MRRRERRSAEKERRGAVLVLVAVCLIPLIACVALAIDVGLMMSARTQASVVADLSAMAGARALNGNTSNGANNNYSAVLPAAQGVTALNTILGSAVNTSQVSVNIGRYTYNNSSQRFEGQFPGPSTENWSMVQSTVNVPIADKMGFSKIFNFTAPNMKATATAIHRPRDVAIVLDYSGSMRFGSIMAMPFSGSRTDSNNQDPLVPTFGAYSSVSAAGLQGSPASPPYNDCNVSFITSDGRPPIVRDFYQSASGTLAFTAASSGYASTPGGDNYLKISKNKGTTYTQTLAGALSITSPKTNTRDATFESSGYTAYGMNSQFYGYTTGPGYWGKTFFLWPPDGRDAQDWRQKFFYKYGTTTACDDNSLLWDSSGNWKAPGSGNYSINYTAILSWLKSTGANPFPSRLQSGRILYYSSIPTTINTSSWPPSDLDQRFWKDYIDYALGVMQTGSSSWSVLNNGSTAYSGYGPDFRWGTVQITANSKLTGSPKPYMHYGDNPLRPNTKFWFGPLTMVDFLGNYNLWYANGVSPVCSRFCWMPGTCHESPMYACKLGIQAALTDIQSNHPNDVVSTIMFSVPRDSASDVSDDRFNRVRVGLGRSYSNMIESLWYPPATIGNASATVSPYDTNNIEVPRATGGTCYSYALMLAYNQFSCSTSLTNYSSGQPAGDAGGNGRKGAQKVIIFETDGAPNFTASASFVNNGSYNSYYKIRYNYGNPTGSEYPTSVNQYGDNDSSVTSQIYSLCQQICARDNASTPGFATANKPVKIHCIGFGPAFSPSSSSAATNKATLQKMQSYGSVTDGMPSYKIIYGTENEVIADLQTAFRTIMADGIQITLIQ